MTEDTPNTRGEAAWRQQREEIAKRNADAHKRAQVERKTRQRAVATHDRVEAAREEAQLDALNVEIQKRRAAGRG